jgi:hypothetical protein
MQHISIASRMPLEKAWIGVSIPSLTPMEVDRKNAEPWITRYLIAYP